MENKEITKDISLHIDSSNENNFDKNTNQTINEKTENILTESKYLVRSHLDKTNNKYPYCIVWTPLPCISWFIPIIGHTGICT
jgi:hypothetical protein